MLLLLVVTGKALDVVTNVVGWPPGTEEVSEPPTGLSLEMTRSEEEEDVVVDGVA